MVDVGLGAAVVGAGAAVIAVPIAAWQLGIAIVERRRQRRESRSPSVVEPGTPSSIDQSGKIHGPRTTDITAVEFPSTPAEGPDSLTVGRPRRK